MKLEFATQIPNELSQKQIEIFFKQVLLELKKKRVRRRSKLSRSSLTLVFLNERRMKSINARFRGKSRSTDVLSFESEDGNSLGELLFCLSVIKRNSKTFRSSLRGEFEFIFLHGILHLLGYDHEVSRREEKLMFQLQKRILDQVRSCLSMN